jgi:cyanophycinase-like exopeptidase
MSNSHTPGPIALFGSGETTPQGQKIFDQLFRQLPRNSRVALLETPAGFELNSAQVIGRVAEFFRHRLQNYQPQIEIIPARQRGTPFSPDDAQITAPLLAADLIFMGPGSPSYAVRQLRGSLAWHSLLARHRLGAALAFSSAAVIAAGAQALPVYEIYKVGEDPHWKPGLDLFAAFGLPLTFIPHWNNSDGGAELDTSRCFMGRARFEPLLAQLPPAQTVVGIDEQTALFFDCASRVCAVRGLGTVTILRGGESPVFASGESFSMNLLGDCEEIADPGGNIPAGIWQAALARQASLAEDRTGPERGSPPPAEVLSLVAQRQKARAARDWSLADALRDQIAAMGWQVQDTPEGPVVSG